MGMDEEMEVETGEGSSASTVKKKAYLPGKPLADGEELVHDPSVYIMLHEGQTGAPCLSFDVIPDGEGNNRTNFPLTTYLVAGTQAERANGNSIIVMKISNLQKTQKEEEESSSESESESDEDEEDKTPKHPVLNSQLIRHHGTVNRIRANVVSGTVLVAAWSEIGKVSIVDIKPQLQCLTDPTNPSNIRNKKKGVGDPIKPLYVFTGHQSEGYGLDWCPTEPGVLATGDCKRNLHIWKPNESGGWYVNKNSLIGHTDSIEDIQWSPKEPNVLATCSIDKSIRIWDTREHYNSACKLTVENAHTSDINVISWNKSEPLIVSGGDDGFIHVWDLRQFKTGSAVASLKHHTDSVTTVEWAPQESSVFASGGADDQITLWDLAVERDESSNEEELKDVPPQLLFIHQGQTDIKELHWHAQIPGMIMSTANSGFNFFKTISV